MPVTRRQLSQQESASDAKEAVAGSKSPGKKTPTKAAAAAKSPGKKTPTKAASPPVAKEATPKTPVTKAASPKTPVAKEAPRRSTRNTPSSKQQTPSSAAKKQQTPSSAAKKQKQEAAAAAAAEEEEAAAAAADVVMEEEEEDDDDDEDSPLFFHVGQSAGHSREERSSMIAEDSDDDSDDDDDRAQAVEEVNDDGFVLDTTPATPSDPACRLDDGRAHPEEEDFSGFDEEDSSDDDEDDLRLAPYLDHEKADFREGALERAGGIAEIFSQPQGSRPSKRSKKDVAMATAGPGWFNVPRNEVTRETKDDARAYAHRAYVDPKRFYKKTDKLSPFAAVGTLIAGKYDSRSMTLTKRERKQTLVAELLSDTAVRSYTKRKYAALQEKKNTSTASHRRKSRASAKIAAARRFKKK